MAKPVRPKSIDLQNPKRKLPAAGESGSKEKQPPYNVLHRITSALWTDENVPFSLYEVTMKTPYLIDVLIVNGRNITKGWYIDCEDNFVDPYIMMRIPNTPNGIKRTKPTTNPKDPYWNEHFYFMVDPHSTNQLEITLIDSSFIKERNMGVVKLHIDRLEINGPPLAREMTFLNGSKVYAKVWKRESLDSPEMRSGLSLTDEEVTFLERRRIRVMEAMNQLLTRYDPDEDMKAKSELSSLSSGLGNTQNKAQGPSTTQVSGSGATANFAPSSAQETPTVAILGSGGGCRACAGFAGAMIGLQKTGMLDCATYVSTVSGSAWYTNFLYSQSQHTRKGPAAFESLLRERMTSSWRQLLQPRSLYRFVSSMAQKASRGQPIGFPDLFGSLIGEKLLGKELAAKPLSAQRLGLQFGAAPLPLYTCLHINKDVAPSVFHEWMEFTPYNVWLSKYGLSMPTELFGCKWFCGVIIRKFVEAPVSYLMGLWGSALSVLFKRLIWDSDKEKYMKEAAVPDIMAIQDLATYRAYKEGYPPLNNDTGTSDVSIIARTTDEDSSSEDNLDELERQARDVQEAQEEMERHKKENMAGRFSRASKKSIKGESTIPQEDSMNSQKGDELKEKIEMIKSRLKIKRFRNYLMAHNDEKESSQRCFWRRMLDSLMSEGVWDTRAARAGIVFNPLRGLVLKPAFARDAVETTVTPRDTEPMKGSYVMADPRSKRWFMMDPGLALNLPFPPLLRPQRAVDVFIAFDFSTRFSDEASPFDHLLLAEHWARIRRLRFPPISTLVPQYLLQPPRECYIFEDENDPLCPLIIFFPLVNNLFRKFRSPGIQRVSMMDKTFGDFPIFSDPNDTYSITNMHYNQQAFDRLLWLMTFNVEQSAPALRAVLETAIQRKRSLLPPACQEMERLKREEEEHAARLARKKRKDARRRRRRDRRNKMRDARRIFMAERPSMLRRRIEAEVEARQKRLEEAMRSDRGNPALARALYNTAIHAERNDSKALITQLMWLAYQSARAAVVRSRKRMGIERASSTMPRVPESQMKRFNARGSITQQQQPTPTPVASSPDPEAVAMSPPGAVAVPNQKSGDLANLSAEPATAADAGVDARKLSRPSGSNGSTRASATNGPNPRTAASSVTRSSNATPVARTNRVEEAPTAEGTRRSAGGGGINKSFTV